MNWLKNWLGGPNMVQPDRWLVMLVTVVGLVAICYLVTASIALLMSENRPDEFGLAFVLGITMGAVIVAAAVTAFTYGLLSSGVPGYRQEAVFRESIKRFALIAVPIAAGYGIAQIVSELAVLFSGVAGS